MVSPQTVLGAAAVVARLGSIPLREQSPGRPPFWAKPIVATKTRPIPAATAWFNYITLRGGFEFFPKGYSAVVNRFIATGKNAAGTGLEYRFLLDDNLTPSQEFSLSPTVDYNVDRAAAAPFPSMVRRCFFNVAVNHVLALQVRNTGVATHIAYAGLFGWYYGAMGMQEREAFETSGFKLDDSVRQPAAGE